MARGKRNRPAPPKPHTNTLFYNSWGIPAEAYKPDHKQAKIDNNKIAKMEADRKAAQIEAAKQRRFEKNKKSKDKPKNDIETEPKIEDGSVNEASNNVPDKMQRGFNPPLAPPPPPVPPRLSTIASEEEVRDTDGDYGSQERLTS